MTDPTITALTSAGPRLPDAAQEHRAAMKSAAMEFEAVFLAEMLSHTGLGKTSDSFGGGAGEDAFKSLLTREWATQLTEKGGVGLSETIYQALLARGGGDV